VYALVGNVVVFAGHVAFVGNNSETVQAKYNSCSDDRMQIINVVWATFSVRNGFEIGDIVMFLFHSVDGQFQISVDVILIEGK
jgi:hypothetical protein